MRPYNFYVNPIPDAKLEIERIFSFQSGGKYSFTEFQFIVRAAADISSCGISSRS